MSMPRALRHRMCEFGRCAAARRSWRMRRTPRRCSSSSCTRTVVARTSPSQNTRRHAPVPAPDALRACAAACACARAHAVLELPVSTLLIPWGTESTASPPGKSTRQVLADGCGSLLVECTLFLRHVAWTSAAALELTVVRAYETDEGVSLPASAGAAGAAEPSAEGRKSNGLHRSLGVLRLHKARQVLIRPVTSLVAQPARP